MNNRLAIIPARGGSKRIPRKNIRSFLGKPIIEYSISAAIKANCFDEVMVSTEDEEIASVARTAGALTPFVRSVGTSGDYSMLADVIEEVLDDYRKSGREFKYFCCILATAPFISGSRIAEAMDMLKHGDADGVVPVVRFPYPIQRALGVEKGKLSMIWPENYNKRSNDLKPAFHDSGQFYCMRVDAFLKQKRLFPEKCLALELSELEVQDIDTPEDWDIAELKYRLLHEEKK